MSIKLAMSGITFTLILSACSYHANTAAPAHAHAYEKQHYKPLGSTPRFSEHY